MDVLLFICQYINQVRGTQTKASYHSTAIFYTVPHNLFSELAKYSNLNNILASPFAVALAVATPGSIGENELRIVLGVGCH